MDSTFGSSEQRPDGGARVVAQEWISLDGFAAGPGGEGDIFAAVGAEADAASQDWNERLLADLGQVLLGRVTYELFAAYWPTAKDPVAERVNTARKTVFSRTLTAAPWGEFADAAVVPDAVRWVRDHRTGGGNLLVWGSLDIVQALLDAGELDELDLFIAPVMLGRGRRLFPEQQAPLRLVTSERWDGTLHVRYVVDPLRQGRHA